MVTAKVQSNTTGYKALQKQLKELAKAKIVLGYTEPVQVELAYLTEFGSPLNNIPKEPYFLKGVIEGLKTTKVSGLDSLVTKCKSNVIETINKNCDNPLLLLETIND